MTDNLRQALTSILDSLIHGCIISSEVHQEGDVY